MENIERKKRKPRIIKNRDIPLLMQTRYLMQEIVDLEKQYEWQKERVFNITRNITGMPGRSGGTPGGFDEILAAMDGTQEKYRDKINEYRQRLRDAERILDGITNPEMRTFVSMMYVNGAPPGAVRKKLNMTEWGFRMARDCVEKAGDMRQVVWKGGWNREENESPS